MSPRPLQSLPSFAHTFPDIAARTQHAASSSPQPRPASKRRYDTVDSSPSIDGAGSPARHSRKQKRLKSPAVHQSSRSRSSSQSADAEDIVVVKEELDTDTDPSPSRNAFPPPAPPSSTSASLPSIYPQRSDSITYTYPDVDAVSRKRRRVTISGAHHLQSLPTRASPNTNLLSPLTPTVSPVVMGFSVPRTPQGIPHKTSVDQVRSALSLKQQQKALIEARRANPGASAASIVGLPLPTPPATGGSASAIVSAPTDASHADSLPHIKTVRTRSRAVTVTTGMAVPSSDYVRESTRAEMLSPHGLTPSSSIQVDPATQPPSVQHSSNDLTASSSAGGLSLLARRRGPSALGVNTSGISNAGSTVNTASAISSQPSNDDAIDLHGRAPRRQASTRTPVLTVRTTGIDVPSIAPQPQPVPQPRPASPAMATPANANPPSTALQPIGSSAVLANSSAIPGISRAIPRHPALNLDPVIRSAPLTMGGRMVVGGRQLRTADWTRTGSALNLPPIGDGARKAGANVSAVASPTVVSRHHSLLFPPQGQQATRSAAHQVPISTTLRTPHVASFTIPPRTASLMQPGASNAGPSGSALAFGPASPPSADKQAFLNMFGQFYDSLNDAKNLKTWLEGQAAKSDTLMSNLERATKDAEAERARLRQDNGAGEEVMRLRSRVNELEERLARLERYGGAREQERDSARMDIDIPERAGTASSSSSPAMQRRPYDYPHHHQPPPPPQQPHQGHSQYAPVHHSHLHSQPNDQPTTGGRGRSGSMNQPQQQYHQPHPATPQHHHHQQRAGGPMPLPPIATLSNGIDDTATSGGRSRKGSLVGGHPPPLPPPSGGRSRRESLSSTHPPSMTAMLPSPLSISKPNSSSPPQRPILPPLGPQVATSPHYEQHAHRPSRNANGMSPLPLVNGSSAPQRLSPLPLQPRPRTPYGHRMQQVVARPTPTPSPPPTPHRLVDVGGRVPGA